MLRSINSLTTSDLVSQSVTSTASLGVELLEILKLGYSAPEVGHLTSRILSINDSLCFIVMSDASQADKQLALDHLLSRLPRTVQPRQVINTLLEFEDCQCEDECSGVPLAPTEQLVDDANNTFSFLPTSCYPNLADYEIEIGYSGIVNAPTSQVVDDVNNTFTFTPVLGISSPDEYEIEII